MTGRNPRTRVARFPFVIQHQIDWGTNKGKWGEVKGTSTYQEAVDYIFAQAKADRRDARDVGNHGQRSAAYRVRSGGKTVFEMAVTLQAVSVSITVEKTIK